MSDSEFQKTCLNIAKPNSWTGFQRGYGHSPIFLANCDPNDFQLKVGMNHSLNEREVLDIRIGKIQPPKKERESSSPQQQRMMSLMAEQRQRAQPAGPPNIFSNSGIQLEFDPVNGGLKPRKTFPYRPIQEHDAIFLVDNAALNLTQALTLALARLAANGDGPKLAYQLYLQGGNDAFYTDLAKLPEGSWSSVANSRAAPIKQRNTAYQQKSIDSHFQEMAGGSPNYAALQVAFEGVAGVDSQSVCASKVAKTLSAVSASLVGVFSQNWSRYGKGGELLDPKSLARLMEKPQPVPPTKEGNSTLGIALKASDDCTVAYLQFNLQGVSTGSGGSNFGQQRFHDFGYAKLVFNDPQSDFGRITLGPVAYRNFGFDNRARFQPEKSLICTPGECMEGDLNTLFPRYFRKLRSIDPWPTPLKAELVALEKQKELADARAYAAQQSAAAKQAAEERVAALENERIARARANRLQAALTAKNGQAMYLAAGSYEREGEKGNAREVYERIVTRFPSSPWAVKANDQLLEIERVSSFQSAAESANQQSGKRAYQACKIEMDTCYNQGGKNCYRNCDNLR